MEDIKLWELDGSKANPLGSNNQLESEELLENTLVENPNLLIEGLTLVGRQTPTEGGPLDLLGVDSDGRLIVFELKRGTLSRDAVAQIIDYASYLDDMALDDLADHISERSGANGIDKIENFHEWYDTQGFGELEALKPLRLFLVGLGAGDRTERMVRFLANNSNMDISLLAFHGFDYDGKTLLAKQVEVEGTEDIDPRLTRHQLGREERLEVLLRRAEENGMRELFIAIRGMFQENWPGLSERISRQSIGLWLQWPTGSGGLRYYSNGRISTEGNKATIHFYSWIIELCADEIRRLVKEMPSEEWSNGEVRFLLTTEEWDAQKQSLTALTQSMYKALQNKIQDGGVDLA